MAGPDSVSLLPDDYFLCEMARRLLYLPVPLFRLLLKPGFSGRVHGRGAKARHAHDDLLLGLHRSGRRQDPPRLAGQGTGWRTRQELARSGLARLLLLPELRIPRHPARTAYGTVQELQAGWHMA